MKMSRHSLHVDVRGQRAFILVSVLIVVTLISMIAISLLFRVKAEVAATAASSSAEQAWSAAMAGVETAMQIINANPSDPNLWQDNPQALRDQLVCDDGADRWYFTVWSRSEAVDSREEIRYGLVDESAKLNINIATETNILRLPGMDMTLTSALLDYLDFDSTARPEGAEQDYYDGLPNAYAIRNGPLACIDELLLVRGFSVPVLYGEDANQNFILDANEDDSEETYPPDNRDGKLDLGLRPYVTVSSYDLNVDSDGAPRTNINSPEDPLPKIELPPALTNYIFLMRSNKITVAHPAELLEATGKFKDASGKEAEVESGVGKAELSQLLDLFTATDEERQTGLINVNTASAKVLATMPEIDDSLAESIVSARRNVAPEKRKSIGWIYSEGLVEADVFKKIAPRLTARGFQYSFHVAGFGVPSGRYRVLEVMVDLGDYKPAIIYLRDLTKLGMPFRVDVERLGMKTAAAPGQGRGMQRMSSSRKGGGNG